MLASPATSAALAGLLFGLSLIVAIGAQNSYVLRQGIAGEYVITVVAICTGSDILLIAAGVAGAGAAFDGRPWLVQSVRLAGAGFLFGYAALAARRAIRPPATAGERLAPASPAAVIVTCLALTWLNPAVYLDTVVLLGSVSNTHSHRQWWFGGGAMLASALWFIGLGGGARLLARWFTKPAGWRTLDVFVALVMASTGVRLLA